MSALPIIETKRLRLRPYTLDDAPNVQRLAGDKRIAATVTSIPHPYPDGAAEEFISSHRDEWTYGRALHLAIELRDTREYIGGIGMHLEPKHRRAEIGYWTGVAHWGQGFATEAAAAMVKFGFEQLGFERMHAHHMDHNPASGRVLEKIGMKREGVLRRHIFHDGRFVDFICYGILRSEYDARRGP